MKSFAGLKQKYIGDRAFYKRYLLLAVPMIVQNAITNLVSFLDNIMVGQLGTEQMSGVAIVNQLIFVYNLAIFGAVSAASIFGAQYFGKGNHKGHMYSFRFKLYATLLVTGLTVFLFVTKGEGLISLYLTDTVGNGATELALQYGKRYLVIMMAGLIPFAVNQAYATNIKETGQTFVPMIASFAAVGANAVLDYLLIFGIGPFPKMGIAGAALATGIGQILTLTIYLFVYNTTEISVRVRRDCMMPNRKMDVSLYAIGILAILNLALPSLLVSFLNSILAAYSQVYVVVLGIYYKLQTFLYLPANGIVQGMRPIIGYNYGAGEDARVKKIYNLTLAMTGTIMAGGTVLCLVFAGPLMNVFSSNPETIAAGQTALRIICAGFIVSSLTVTGSGALEGLGKGTESLIISLVRYIIAMMPIAWVLCRLLGPTGVWHAFWICEAITVVISYTVYRKASV